MKITNYRMIKHEFFFNFKLNSTEGDTCYMFFFVHDMCTRVNHNIWGRSPENSLWATPAIPPTPPPTTTEQTTTTTEQITQTTQPIPHQSRKPPDLTTPTPPPTINGHYHPVHTDPNQHLANLNLNLTLSRVHAPDPTDNINLNATFLPHPNS